jgi:hypothetical protein
MLILPGRRSSSLAREAQLYAAYHEAGCRKPRTWGEIAENWLERYHLYRKLQMSFTTGTNTELMFSSSALATQLNTFTAEDNLQKTYPPIIIPAGFIQNLSATGKSLKVKANGRLGTTGSPTFTWSARLLTLVTWSAAGILLGTTGAVTAGATKTLSPWFLDLDIVLQTLSIGGASTLKTMGEVRGPSALASPFAFTIPADNTAPTVATFDNSVTYYLFLSAACGTSNAANLIQLEMLKVYGEN